MDAPSNQNATEPLPAAQKSQTPPKRKLLPHGCLPWGFAVFVVSVLVGLMIPVGFSSGHIGPQTRALAQAKQVGLALKLFASDHDGNYPGQGVPVEMQAVPRNSNQVFACLFPTYTTSERIFGDKLSAYQTGKGPDDLIDNPYTGHPVQTLRPGENVYGCVVGLNDSANPSAPLVVDGSDGTGHYNRDPHRRGGARDGTRVVVVHLDNSAGLVNLRGPEDRLYLPRSDDPSKNLLDTGYLGKEVRYLDPAVAGP